MPASAQRRLQEPESDAEVSSSRVVRAPIEPTRARTFAGTSAVATPTRRPSSGLVFFLAVVSVLAIGYWLPSSAYLTPQSGAGYALGIVGGSLMLLLLLYPLRKRLPQAHLLGSTRFWFRTHMVFGVLGPAAILLHSNFSLGATNSNVALVCMLVVAGSGLFGRYFYGRIHVELHGHEATLEELKAFSGRMRHMTSAVSYLPELARRIDDEEDRFTATVSRTPLLLRPIVGAIWAFLVRRRLRLAVMAAVAAGADRRHDPRRDSLQASAFRYVDDRIRAARRVHEFRAFERLFSLWHALHMPLFVMLLIAGVVHVFAVHVY